MRPISFVSRLFCFFCFLLLPISFGKLFQEKRGLLSKILFSERSFEKFEKCTSRNFQLRNFEKAA